MTNKRSKINNKRRFSSPRQEPSAGATTYNGPFPSSLKAADTLTAVLVENDTISTSVGGGISAAFGNNPSSSSNWTEFVGSWDEYRVLAIRYSYDPNNVVNTATINGFNGYSSIVHGISSTPATLTGAASTGVAKRFNAFRPFTRMWKMAGPAESDWVSTSGPISSSNTLFLFAVGGTASTYYGNILTEYYVQFRTKRF